MKKSKEGIIISMHLSCPQWWKQCSTEYNARSLENRRAWVQSLAAVTKKGSQVESVARYLGPRRP